MPHDHMSFGFALTPQEAADLLVELGTEDSPFRAALQEDPLKALRARGIAVAPHNVPETVDLPSPEEVRSILANFVREDGTFDDEDIRPPFPWHPFLAVAIMWRWHPFSFPSES